MDSFFWRAWHIALVFVWIVLFWCVFAPMLLGTIEQLLGLNRRRHR